MQLIWTEQVLFVSAIMDIPAEADQATCNWSKEANTFSAF